MGRKASRGAQAGAAALIARLTNVKMMLVGMKGAMPTMAAELRREAGETIDDIIQDLRG